MRRGPSQPWPLRSYPRVHLAYRVAVRVRLALLDPTTSTGRRAAQVPLLALDLVNHRRLGDLSRPPLLPARLLADALEVAWAAATDGAGHAQVNVTIPLASEAGLRHGTLAGVGVPALHVAVAGTASRARGRRQLLTPFLWPVAGAVAGIALRRAETRRVDRVAEQHRVEQSARRRRAELAGEHSLAMGLDSAIDALGNVHWLMSAGGADPYRARKRDLADAARSEATYLADAVMAWAGERNRRSPDLTDDVVVDVVAGGSQSLLSDAQVADLGTGLDALHLRGRVRVEGPAQHICGRALVVEVDDGKISVGLALDADPSIPVPPLDPSPVPLGMMVPWLGYCAHPDHDGVPIWRAAPGTIAGATAAVVLYRRTRRTGRPVSREGLACALGIGLLHTVLATPGVRNDRSVDGNQPHPWVGALYAPLVLFGLERDRLSPNERRAAVVAMATIVLTGLVLHPFRPAPRAMTGILDVGIALAAASGWGDDLDAQAAEVAATSASADADALDVAFRRGRERVRRSVVDGVEDARRRMAADGARLDPRVRAEVSRRLDRIEADLAAIDD